MTDLINFPVFCRKLKQKVNFAPKLRPQLRDIHHSDNVYLKRVNTGGILHPRPRHAALTWIELSRSAHPRMNPGVHVAVI